MPELPLVSILLPVYNGEQTLKTTMESLLNQTYTKFEILIGIDGTKDGSKVIAESFQDPRIKIIDHPKNLGVANNLNVLIKHMAAESEYFAIAEQDDLYVPERLEWQIAVMQKHPEVGLVSGIAKFLYEEDEVLFPGLLCRGEQFPQLEDLFKFLYIKQLKVVNSCMMVRKQVHLENYFSFNNRYGNFNVDWDYVLRFCLASNIYGIPKLLVIMNRGFTNTSVTRDKRGQHQASRQLLKDFLVEFNNILSRNHYQKALKEHRKVELGHHTKWRIIFLGIYYTLLYQDLYFLNYLLKRIKRYLK